MGFLVVTAVLVVSFGRLGDMFGRVRMYNLGFAVFTRLLDPARRSPGSTGSARRAVAHRHAGRPGRRRRPAVRQLHARSSPTPSRPTSAGTALGINGVAAIAGSFLGLILGGVLAAVDWQPGLPGLRARSACSAPSGPTSSCRTTACAAKAEHRLAGATSPSPSAWSRCSSASPTASSPTAATPWAGPSPFVLAELIGGVAVLVVFVVDRDPGRRPDVPARPVPHPRLHRRQRRRPARRRSAEAGCSSC